jgi:hypothetical protein
VKKLNSQWVLKIRIFPSANLPSATAKNKCITSISHKRGPSPRQSVTVVDCTQSRQNWCQVHELFCVSKFLRLCAIMSPCRLCVPVSEYPLYSVQFTENHLSQHHLLENRNLNKCI